MVILLFFAFTIQAQTITEKRIVSEYNFDLPHPGESFLKIPVNFNADNLLSQIPDSLNNLVIQRVDVVYTTFATSPAFNQEKLNQQRINKLQKVWRKALDPSIIWAEIGQNVAKNRNAAKKLFHGFVIYYRPTPTKKTIEKELSFIDAILKGEKPIKEEPVFISETETEFVVANAEWSTPSTSNIGKTPYTECHLRELVRLGTLNDNIVIPDQLGCYNVHIFCRRTTMKNANIITDSLSKCSKSIGVSKYWVEETEVNQINDYIFTWAERIDDCIADTPDTIMPSYLYNWFNAGDYGIVEAVFSRNPQWKNAHIVMDVTGSMSPYIAKTMVWAKSTQESSQVMAYTFFNDGDSKLQHEKQIGKVGGIYSVKNSAFEPVYNKMKKTMLKGGGGDAPENNVEAIIKGIKTFPNCTEIIMVADNWATPRDLSLVKELNIPVHIILCGAINSTNVAYIQLAYDTGGSVHTIEEDLIMRDIEPGKTLKIGNTYFTLFNGRIEVAKNKY